MTTSSWHSLPYKQALTDLDTDAEKGLRASEAQTRLEKYGRNELREEPRPGFFTRLINQFKNLVIILLIVAAIISAFFGDWYEAGAIIMIVVLNAALGVIQEGKAEEALAALKKMSAPEAHLVRDGHVVTIPGSEVVPGDVILLEAGNYVPADLRLIETANLQIDEASMTGESVPVGKDASRKVADDAVLGDRKTMAYKSTIVTYGRGKGVVTATGMQTEIGKIAEMIQSVEEELTPLQRRLDQLGAVLVYVTLAICGVVFLVAFVQAASRAAGHLNLTTLGDFFGALGNPELTKELIDSGIEAFETAVALAVAAVPEGLPAIVTINLALGMREMVKRHALIRRLPAVETLGSASAICSDKTGTLTQNEMTAVRLYVPDLLFDVSGEGYAPEGRFHQSGDDVVPEEMPDLIHLLTGALLCSDARLEALASGEGKEFRIAGDPTEGALVVAAAKANLTRERMDELYPRRDELPFDSVRKRMSTLHNDPDSNHYILFVKGAPDMVLELCKHVYDQGEVKPLSKEMREHIANVNRDMAQSALRVLAVAERRFDKHPPELSSDKHEKDLTFVGLVGMIDPARPEVKPAIERARSAGIKTVMVTGDYPDTARAIAQEIGLLREGGRVVTGAELQKTSDEALANMLTEVDVFARVSPEHKVRIVDAFRKRDYVVAMTGDGVNDAPALKRASIGVAMGITGTDVSKETADMVLTDDNYVSIVNAVEQGRIIYDNIRKFVYYLLSCNVAEIMTILLGTLMGYPSPLTPIQLLWLNLLTDGFPALALGVEKGDPDTMSRSPRPPDEPIIDHIMRIGMTVQTIAITGATLGGFLLGIRHGGITEGRTIAFTVLTISELLRSYTARSEFFSLFRIGPFSNKYMQYAVGLSLLLLLVVIYVPFFNPIFNTRALTLMEWTEIIPLVLLPSVAAEVTKIFLRAEQKKKAAIAETAA